MRYIDAYTSSLEANNCRLNDSVMNHGNFFSFTLDLRKEEFMKSKEIETHIISGGKQHVDKKDEHVCFKMCSCVLLIAYKQFHIFLCLFFFSTSSQRNQNV